MRQGLRASGTELEEVAAKVLRAADLAPFAVGRWKPLADRLSELRAMERLLRSEGAERAAEAARVAHKYWDAAWELPSASPQMRGQLPPGPPPPPPRLRDAMFGFPLPPPSAGAATACNDGRPPLLLLMDAVPAPASDGKPRAAMARESSHQPASATDGPSSRRSTRSTAEPDIEVVEVAEPLPVAPPPPPPIRLTFQPDDFGTSDVAAPPWIGLTREPLSRGGGVLVYARLPIPAGTRLGWFEGLVIPGAHDPLVNLHPYCVTRTARPGDADDSIIGDPEHWVTHIGYEGPQRAANVDYWGQKRDPPPDATRNAAQNKRRAVRWPFVYATRDIAVREVLALPTDPGYAAATQERLDVFSALCELAAQGITPSSTAGDVLSMRQINARLCERFKQIPSDLSLWEPLIRRARHHASEAAAAEAAAAEAAASEAAASETSAAAVSDARSTATSRPDCVHVDLSGESDGDGDDVCAVSEGASAAAALSLSPALTGLRSQGSATLPVVSRYLGTRLLPFAWH